jgi:hypothetical protein
MGIIPEKILLQRSYLRPSNQQLSVIITHLSVSECDEKFPSSSYYIIHLNQYNYWVFRKLTLSDSWVTCVGSTQPQRYMYTLANLFPDRRYRFDPSNEYNRLGFLPLPYNVSRVKFPKHCFFLNHKGDTIYPAYVKYNNTHSSQTYVIFNFPICTPSLRNFIVLFATF